MLCRKIRWWNSLISTLSTIRTNNCTNTTTCITKYFNYINQFRMINDQIDFGFSLNDTLFSYNKFGVNLLLIRPKI